MKTTNEITKDILNLEKKYWTAMKDHDLDMALALTDFPCIVAGSHGAMSVDQDQFKKMFHSNEGSVRNFQFDENNAQVRLIGIDTAVIAYKIHSTLSDKDSEKIIDAVDTSTWIRRDNKWLCAMHTETELLKS